MSRLDDWLEAITRRRFRNAVLEALARIEMRQEVGMALLDDLKAGLAADAQKLGALHDGITSLLALEEQRKQQIADLVTALQNAGVDQALVDQATALGSATDAEVARVTAALAPPAPTPAP